MACPLFLPGSRFPCAAARESEIDEHKLRTCCEVGYARGECDRAASAEADAIRFIVKSHAYGVVEVAWSTERDHLPVAVGTLRLREVPEGDSVPELQARAYVSTYLRRTGRAW